MRTSVELLLLWLFCASIAFSCQSEAPKKPDTDSIFDQIYSEEDIINLEIKGDMAHLFLPEHEEDHFHPAQITIKTADETKFYDASISRRGVTRRKICDFPPVRIKFSKKELKEEGLSKYNSYKLVTHCMEEEAELVLKEYLTYKLFNQITDNSFRVQLAKINYLDDSQKMGSETYYGFLIESNKELAKRLNGKLIDAEKKKITAVDKDQYRKLAIFQYMVGNTDWNLTRGHNIKWVQIKSNSSPTPIPYDFDYCGLVNAPYAVPHPQLPIKHVQERMLQWRGKSKDELIPICESFKAQKDKILQQCKAFELLDPTVQEEMVSYLESFFESVDKGDWM